MHYRPVDELGRPPQAVPMVPLSETIVSVYNVSICSQPICLVTLVDRSYDPRPYGSRHREVEDRGGRHGRSRYDHHHRDYDRGDRGRYREYNGDRDRVYGRDDRGGRWDVGRY